MKRVLSILLIFCCLVGCSSDNSSMNKLYQFRETLLASKEVFFQAEITADYAQEFYTFQVACSGDEAGNLTFEVIHPDTISGIRGTVSRHEGHLTFDDHALVFNTMADDRITPVTAPWVLLTALRSGFITACGKTDTGYSAVIRDSYDEDFLSIDVLFEDDSPTYAEVFWNQTRVITMGITDFSCV